MRSIHFLYLLKINVILIIALAFSGFSQKQAARETPVPQPADTAICKNIVQNYCSLWKNRQFDSMYVILNRNGLGSMTKEQFENVYKPSQDNSGKLTNYTIKQATPNQDGMIVKVVLVFFKEKLPVLVNGGFNFHLKMDGGAWKIQAIVAPVKVPGVESKKGDGHPG